MNGGFVLLDTKLPESVDSVAYASQIGRLDMVSLLVAYLVFSLLWSLLAEYGILNMTRGTRLGILRMPKPKRLRENKSRII